MVEERDREQRFKGRKKGAKKYPDPSDYKDHALAKKVNALLDRFDPKQSASSECEVGEAFAATLDYYKDVDVHPAAWLAFNSTLYLIIIGARRVTTPATTAGPRRFGGLVRP